MLLLIQKSQLQELSEHTKSLRKKLKKLLRILTKLVKMQKKNSNNFVLKLRVALSLKRKHVLSLKKLVTHCSAFKTFHQTLVLVKKQSLHLLRLTSTFARQLIKTKTLKQKKKKPLLLVLKVLKQLKMQCFHGVMQLTLRLTH